MTTESATNRIDHTARDVIIAGLQSQCLYYDSETMPGVEADAILSALTDAGLRIVPDALLVACGYLITFGDKDTDLARTTHAQIEAYRSTAPDAGHAAEPVTITVSRNELVSMISELLYQHTSRNQEQAISDAERAVRLLVEHTAPARTAGTETK